ncbi:Ser-Thr-rich glycosyl-phosphatidyl-inositol-anchored membrane family-domain-containing protein [Aspergillus granulosus]|uniref:Ser-Thr-rich glycosyl-phosphatidyl-inositol-anchored membrane family-domain-containing protein n=1 Tax=Aspergillus granulosus TaxID=176169 RepID=A0ABR4HH33_9EURO
MRSIFFVALSAVATLVAARENPFNIPPSGYEFTAGESTTLSWDPTTEGTVTLKLQWGESFTSTTGETIISGLPNSGSYTWTVPDDVADRDDYSIEIVSDTDPSETNYLPRFSIVGAVETTTTTTETSTTTTTTRTTTTTTSTTTTTTETTETPTPTPSPTSSTSSTTLTTTTTTESSTTESATPTPTEVPSVNDDDSAGISNRVSGPMLALALGVIALI